MIVVILPHGNKLFTFPRCNNKANRGFEIRSSTPSFSKIRRNVKNFAYPAKCGIQRDAIKIINLRSYYLIVA